MGLQNTNENVFHSFGNIVKEVLQTLRKTIAAFQLQSTMMLMFCYFLYKLYYFSNLFIATTVKVVHEMIVLLSTNYVLSNAIKCI